MAGKKVSNFLIFCGLLLVLGFIIKIVAHSLVNTLNQEKILFSTLEFIFPAVILLIVSLYVRRRSNKIEVKR